MPYRYTYNEILEMLRRTVLDTNIARKIARRGGVRPGESGAGHIPILSICPPNEGASYNTVDSGGVYYFPRDGIYHISQWDISSATQVRISIVVDEATSAGATLSPVWAESFEELRNSVLVSIQDWNFLGAGVSPSTSGFYVTEWEDLPAEALAAIDIYFSFMLVVDSTIENLQFGIAEIHIR